MIVVMNKFNIKNEFVDEFIERWKNRNSYLSSVEGFVEFHLLKASPETNYCVVSSFVKWQNFKSFENWTKSNEFKKAHANASETAHMHFKNANLEIYEVVI